MLHAASISNVRKQRGGLATKMKESLRNTILLKRNNLNEILVRKKSMQIKQNLLALDKFIKSGVIHCYVSKDKEVGTHELITSASKTKTIVVPYLQKMGLGCAKLDEFERLRRNSFGVLEPENPDPFPENKINLVIVPGMVFDRKGNRLGYGKGFYVKFLPKRDVIKIGLAYSFQVVNLVPKEEHDIKMDYVITEDEVIRCDDGQ